MCLCAKGCQLHTIMFIVLVLCILKSLLEHPHCTVPSSGSSESGSTSPAFNEARIGAFGAYMSQLQTRDGTEVLNERTGRRYVFTYVSEGHNSRRVEEKARHRWYRATSECGCFGATAGNHAKFGAAKVFYNVGTVSNTTSALLLPVTLQ